MVSFHPTPLTRVAALAALTFAVLWPASRAAHAAPTHPLDPMDSSEMALCKSVLEASHKLSPNVIYSWVQIKEPPKAEVLAWRWGRPFRREAYVVAIDHARKSSFEVVVDLHGRKVVSVRRIKNLQPFLASSEFDSVNDIIDADGRIKHALQARGYKVPGKVSDTFYCDPYAPGEDAWLKKHPMRAIRVMFADKRGSINIYGPYVEGLMAIIDLHARKVARIENDPGYSGPNVHPPHDIFSPTVLGQPRGGLKPLVAQQSDGPSYTRNGNRISWQGFDFRYSFNLREGLVLHQLGWRDKTTGKLRPILYRASVSEMLVPYSDPSPEWLWREFFDSGEYGLGLSSTEVRAGRELPANAVSLDAILPDEELKQSAYADRIYLYERDSGPLVFHKQWTDGSRVYARGRELVIGFVATVGNYDYFFSWVFKQDGSFEMDVDLEGMLLNKTVKGGTCVVCGQAVQGGPGQTYMAGGDERTGTLVAKNILGVYHQHWINLRLDFDVDGRVNAVKEYNTRPLPSGRSNPRGRAFGVTETVFGTEKSAARNPNAATNRCWVVYNPAVTSDLSHASGYLIEPLTNTPTSIPARRASEPVGFTSKQFWATAYKPQELYAAGAFPNQAPHGYTDFLPRYAGKESVYKRDVVVWYNLGFTHITRPEDYPIMPAAHIAVAFQPDGFFRKSPVLDILTVERGK